jgi:DNA processing protein
VAVLGCGLDVDYPAEHRDLKEEIARVGGVLSEHAPGEEPQRGHFPRRNRLVAALAQALVVVEAPRQSGALITAGLALELGREVLAVPGPVTRDASRGCHHLLREGSAALCEGAGDVFRALGLDPLCAGPAGDAGRSPPPPGPALAVWQAIAEDEAVDLDTLCLRTRLAPRELASALALLEIEGRVARVPGVGVRRL